MRFDEVNLDENVLQGIEAMNFQEMTPVQEQTIPVILEGKDIIGCAQTGTGKTAAYTLPLLSRLVAEGNPDNHIRAVIMVPTRELAQQIDMQFEGFSYFLPISTTVVYGGGDGAGWDQQKKGLLMGADVVIATPGRLLSHIANSGIDLSQVSYFILDEADRMLDMGFFKDVTRIIDKVKNRKNLGLFSATISQEVMTVSWMYQRDEVEITVEPKQEDRPDIDQFSITCTPLEKAETSLRLIRSQGYERVMIFCNTKHMCQRLCDEFQRAGLDCDCIHGDIRQSQREKTMQRYRDGKLAVLIATDVASRGIDVDDVDCVINYDVPEENEYYVHRIGRTGRAKKKGVAWSIVSNFPEEARLDDICKYCNFTIQPMVMDKDGNLSPEEVKAPVTPKRRFR